VGSEYDRLVIGGAATLAGELDLMRLEGFVPMPYTAFTILTAGAVSGTFDVISGMDAGGGMAWAASYFPTRVEVMAVLPGDLNLDQQVTIADFLGLAGHFGQADATWKDGDINGDGGVSIADFLGLAGNFGRSYVTPVGVMNVASAAVPEPGVVGMVGFLAAVLCGRRRRF
jgi:hypothetical protein